MKNLRFTGRRMEASVLLIHSVNFAPTPFLILLAKLHLCACILLRAQEENRHDITLSADLRCLICTPALQQHQ